MRRLPVVAVLLFAWLGSLLFCSTTLARGGPEFPKPLDPGIFISDRAIVLTIGDVTRLNKAAAEVFETSGVPIVVVTIKSVEEMGGDPAGGIEKYARDLFNHWGIGSAKDNRGILLLLSSGDRRARIQLGSAWPPSQDAVTQKIMDTSIVPAIKRGAVAQGLLAGVTDLGAMIAESDAARRQAPPSNPAPASVPPPTVAPPPLSFFDLPLVVPGLMCFGTVFVLGAIVLVIRGIKRRGGGGGASSSAYGMGVSAGLHDAWSGGHSYDSGGGHSGGDSGGGGGGGGGGGSSDGGGSTGSW